MAAWKQSVRISCAALCRIEHRDQYFLMINRNRQQKGLPILTPVGGAIEATNPAVFASMNAIREDNANNDLRLHMDFERLPEFREWFYARQDRELSPFRELHEELVLETGILPQLHEQDVVCKLRTTVEDTRLTNRSGQTGIRTEYFWEIFDVEVVSLDALMRLIRTTPEQGAAWLTQTQIVGHDSVKLSANQTIYNFFVAGDMLFREQK